MTLNIEGPSSRTGTRPLSTQFQRLSTCVEGPCLVAPAAEQSPGRLRREPSAGALFQNLFPISLPEMACRRRKTRKIALNEWPLSEAWIASLNVWLWA
jgi:hypothetical protein